MTSSQDDRTIIRPLFAARLRVHGPSGRTFEVPLAPGVLSIGRDPGCGLPLDPADVSVSRRHASLAVDGETVTVADCGSTNGVFVNGTKVEQAALVPGDEVRLGQTVLTIEAAPLPAAPGPDAAGTPSESPGRRLVPRKPKARFVLLSAILAAGILVTGMTFFFRPDAPVSPPTSAGREQEAAAPDTAPPPSDKPTASAEEVEQAKDLTRQGLFFYNNNHLIPAIGEWEKALALDRQNAQAAKWLARAESERDGLLDKYSREGALALKYDRVGEAREAFRLVTEYCRASSTDERCADAAKQLAQLEGKAP